jgi:uncharacterized protein YqjF (DUF2071 family)
MTPSRTFLTAGWRYIAMLNYEVAPSLLSPFVPRGTELDDWNGAHVISIVGFLFQEMRVLGFPACFNRNFEEVNLRLYVRRKVGDEWRRGVVFIKELVPRAIVAAAARTLYNENYAAVPMNHRLEGFDENPAGPKLVQYSWSHGGRENAMRVHVTGFPRVLKEGSQEEFITEHYWGYTPQRDGSTLEYRVDHPRWRVWNADGASLDCDAELLYGGPIAGVLGGSPSSSFLAEGSDVRVFRGRKLPL